MSGKRKRERQTDRKGERVRQLMTITIVANYRSTYYVECRASGLNLLDLLKIFHSLTSQLLIWPSQQLFWTSHKFSAKVTESLRPPSNGNCGFKSYSTVTKVYFVRLTDCLIVDQLPHVKYSIIDFKCIFQGFHTHHIRAPHKKWLKTFFKDFWNFHMRTNCMKTYFFYSGLRSA